MVATSGFRYCVSGDGQPMVLSIGFSVWFLGIGLGRGRTRNFFQKLVSDTLLIWNLFLLNYLSSYVSEHVFCWQVRYLQSGFCCVPVRPNPWPVQWSFFVALLYMKTRSASPLILSSTFHCPWNRRARKYSSRKPLIGTAEMPVLLSGNFR